MRIEKLNKRKKMFSLNAQNVRIIIIDRINEIFEDLKNELTNILRESDLPAVGVQRTNITINQVCGGQNIEIRIDNDVSMEKIQIPVQKIRNFVQKIEAGEILRQERNSDRHRYVSSYINTMQTVIVCSFVQMNYLLFPVDSFAYFLPDS